MYPSRFTKDRALPRKCGACSVDAGVPSAFFRLNRSPYDRRLVTGLYSSDFFSTRSLAYWNTPVAKLNIFAVMYTASLSKPICGKSAQFVVAVVPSNRAFSAQFFQPPAHDAVFETEIR